MKNKPQFYCTNNKIKQQQRNHRGWMMSMRESVWAGFLGDGWRWDEMEMRVWAGWLGDGWGGFISGRHLSGIGCNPS